MITSTRHSSSVPLTNTVSWDSTCPVTWLTRPHVMETLNTAWPETVRSQIHLIMNSAVQSKTCDVQDSLFEESKCVSHWQQILIWSPVKHVSDRTVHHQSPEDTLNCSFSDWLTGAGFTVNTVRHQHDCNDSEKYINAVISRVDVSWICWPDYEHSVCSGSRSADLRVCWDGR